MNKRIYIAGPMTGYADFNFPAFHDAERMLRKLYPDAAILNPATQFNGRQDLPYEVYIAGAIDLVKICDTIYLLPGWEYSNGAKMEYMIAKCLGHSILGERLPDAGVTL